MPKYMETGNPPPNDYDIEEARRIVESQPFEDIQFPNSSSIDRHIQDQIIQALSTVGFTVNLSKANYSLFDPTAGEIPFWLTHWSPDLGDPLLIFEIFKTGSVYVPEFAQDDSRYRDLLEEA